MESKLGQVLVVDDELELKNILVQSLTLQGYDVQGCTSGPEGLALLRENNFDVVLTDLMMPEMDGITLLKSALEIDPHLVVIMMTGHGTIQTAVDAMKFGAFDYVLKPFRLQGIAPVLARGMNARRLHLENVHLRETLAIHELAQTIAFTLDHQTLLNKLAEAAVQQTDADEVSILLPASADEFYVAAVRGEKRERLLGERVPYEQTISSWVARERQGLILNGEISDQRFVALWPRPEIRSAISLPMQVGNKLVGVLNVNVIKRARPFTLGQMKALSILASTAAAALESASLYTQVQKAEKNYRSIFENAIEGVFQATRDGGYLNANPAMARILGYDSPDDLIESVTDIARQLFVDPKCRSEVLLVIDSQGVLHDFEVELYRKDGQKIWVSMNIRSVRDDSGSELYCEGTLEDITERKRSEQELRKLSLIVESSRDFIGIASPEGPVLYVNRTGREMVGLDSNEQVRATRLLDYVPKEDQEQAGSILAEVLEKGHWEGETLFRNFKTGALIPMLQHVFMITEGEAGNYFALATICRDISDRKQAEEMLADRERQMRALVTSLDDIVFEFDEQGTFINIWAGDDSSLARPRAEVLGKNAGEIFGEEFARPFLASFKRVLASGQHEDIEYPLEVNSELRWFLARISRVSAVQGVAKTVCMLVRDITERKQAEEERERLTLEIEKQRERLDSLISSVPGVVWEAWGKPDEATQRINFVSDYVESMLGYSIEEWLATPNFWLTIVHPDDRDAAGQEAAESFASGTGHTMEFRWLTKDGQTVWVESSWVVVRDDEGRPAGLRGVNTNISERKRAEVELTFQKSLLESQTEASIDGILVTSSERKILSLNQRFVELWGVSEDLLRHGPGESALQSVIDKVEDPEEFLKGVDYLYRHPEESGRDEIQLNDGRTLDRYSAPIKSADDEYFGRVWFFRDITERRQLEDQLRQSQKMEAIGQLAGGVAHDFNNLLTAINGYSSLALQRTTEGETIHSYLEEIKKAGDRAANLTRQLLAFGRKQMLQPIALNLNSVVGDMNKMLRRLIGEDINLTAKFDPALKQITADPGQIEQVLVNLVVNARDAMPDGGDLTIETKNFEIDGEYAQTHLDVKPGNYVMLAVSDTGTGMDAVTRTRIFEPFFTTKEKGKGTGLGLSTAYGIVRQSGGGISVYSEPGRGTSFKIYLPQLENAIDLARSKVIEDPAPVGSETILLVEDEDVVRGLARKILEGSGYRVLEANGGAEAIRMCEEDGEPIDLLLTDVVMPEMGGREIADRLKVLRPATRVLFMSGYTDQAIVHHGIVDSGVEFIQKPFNQSALAKKVREVLDLQTSS